MVCFSHVFLALLVLFASILNISADIYPKTRNDRLRVFKSVLSEKSKLLDNASVYTFDKEIEILSTTDPLLTFQILSSLIIVVAQVFEVLFSSSPRLQLKSQACMIYLLSQWSDILARLSFTEKGEWTKAQVDNYKVSMIHVAKSRESQTAVYCLVNVLRSVGPGAVLPILIRDIPFLLKTISVLLSNSFKDGKVINEVVNPFSSNNTNSTITYEVDKKENLDILCNCLSLLFEIAIFTRSIVVPLFSATDTDQVSPKRTKWLHRFTFVVSGMLFLNYIRVRILDVIKNDLVNILSENIGSIPGAAKFLASISGFEELNVLPIKTDKC